MTPIETCGCGAPLIAGEYRSRWHERMDTTPQRVDCCGRLSLRWDVVYGGPEREQGLICAEGRGCRRRPAGR